MTQRTNIVQDTRGFSVVCYKLLPTSFLDIAQQMSFICCFFAQINVLRNYQNDIYAKQSLYQTVLITR